MRKTYNIYAGEPVFDRNGRYHGKMVDVGSEDSWYLLNDGYSDYEAKIDSYQLDLMGTWRKKFPHMPASFYVIA